MARRGYVQIVNGFHKNRKVRKLRQMCPSAVGAFVMIVSYCGDELTDGHIDEDTMLYVLQITDEELNALCAVDMIEPDGNGGYDVHDYLMHNRSRAQVMKKREREQERYRTKTENSDSVVNLQSESRQNRSNTDETSDSDGRTSAEADSAEPLPSESRLNRDKHQNTRTPEHIPNGIFPPVGPPREGDAQASLFDAPSEPVKKKRRSKTLLSETWRPGARHERRAREVGADLRIEATKFANWAIANGKTYADWDRAFDNWLLNSRKYDGPSKTDGRSPSRSQMNLAANMAKTWEYMTDEERARFTGGGLHAVQG